MAPAPQHDTTELRKVAFQRTLEGVLVVTPDGGILKHNPAAERILGWGGLDVQGLDWVGLTIPPTERLALRRRLSGDLRDLTRAPLRFELMRPDGSSFPAELTIQTCRLQDAQALMVFVRDITEQVRVDRLKSEFVSTVSHELRTPLTSISGSLSLLLGGVAGDLPAPAKQMVEIALNNSRRLVRLINDILDIEKIESGRMDFRTEEQPLRPVLEQALQANRGYAEEHDVTFQLVVEPAVAQARVDIDGDRILQVLTHLLSNAAKYSPAQGEVEVRAAPRGQGVRLSVRDRGEGIPPEFQSRVFQKFAQADSSTTRQVGGTGLGLSICRAIVEEHGGEIDFRTGPDGTTFFFDLPLAAAQRSPAELDTGPAQSRILVVEDDGEAANLIRMTLRAAGHRTEVSGSVSEALERLADTEYHALVLDLGLPDGNGATVLQELGGRIPTVIVSATAGLVIPEEMRVVAQIQKPFDRVELCAAVTRALDLKRPDRPRILHVEDDPDIVSVVSMMVGTRAEVTPVGSCCDALWELETGAYDLVILDCDLPDGSGTSLIDHIEVPVIVFSAQELPPSPGCVATFVKSRTSCEELLASIERTLNRRAA